MKIPTFSVTGVEMLRFTREALRMAGILMQLVDEGLSTAAERLSTAVLTRTVMMTYW
jgi:hypothetical protein